MLMLVGLCLVIGTCGLWRKALEHHSRLDEGAYRSFSPLICVMRHPVLVALAAAPVVLAAATGAGWGALGETGQAVRIAAVIMASVLAWAYATYERNYLYERAHLLERLALPILACAIWMHPAAVAPFLMVLFVVLGQFDHPRTFFATRTPVRLPIDLLSTAGIGALLASVGVGEPGVVPIAMLAVFGAHYAAAGLAKLRLAEGVTWWLRRNELVNLFINAHAQGWMSRLSGKSAARLAGILRRGTPVLAAATLAVELGAVLAPVHPWVAVGVLGGCIVLHAGIYATSAINFYKWATADAALIVMTLVLVESGSGGMFGWGALWATLLVLPLAMVVMAPVRLGWSDTRLCIYFRFIAVGESGTTYELPAAFFAPLDVIFAQGRFYFLRRRPHLVDTFGCNTRRDERANGLAEAICATGGDPEAITRLCAHRGLKKYDPASANVLEEVIRRACVRPGRHRWWRRLLRACAAPKHIDVGMRGVPYHDDEPLREIIVRAVETYAHPSGRIDTVHDEVVLRINVGEPVLPAATRRAA
ncbi:MAG: hypothetical protein KIT24_07090 [Phycisphaeraceae bacterium]|nr:hypothetical protein [Phycisphaeraceae bacterium]